MNISFRQFYLVYFFILFLCITFITNLKFAPFEQNQHGVGNGNYSVTIFRKEQVVITNKENNIPNKLNKIKKNDKSIVHKKTSNKEKSKVKDTSAHETSKFLLKKNINKNKEKKIEPVKNKKTEVHHHQNKQKTNHSSNYSKQKYIKTGGVRKQKSNSDKNIGAGKGGSDQNIGSGKGVLDYKQQVISYLQKYKFYPPLAKRRHIQGRTKIKLLINCKGVVSKSDITSTSGSAILDNATMKMINEHKQLPKPNNCQKPYEFNLSIAYKGY